MFFFVPACICSTQSSAIGRVTRAVDGRPIQPEVADRLVPPKAGPTTRSATRSGCVTTSGYETFAQCGLLEQFVPLTSRLSTYSLRYASSNQLDDALQPFWYSLPPEYLRDSSLSLCDFSRQYLQ